MEIGKRSRKDWSPLTFVGSIKFEDSYYDVTQLPLLIKVGQN